MGEHGVVVVGGGPTGLMLAAELALGGVDVLVVERRTDQHVEGPRARGLYPRTLEVLDQRGVVDRFVEAGQGRSPRLGFGGTTLDLGDVPSRHNYVLALPQRRFEPLLANWVEELGVPVRRGSEVVGLAQDDHGVDIGLADGTSLRAPYVVGCDGGRSVVRKAVDIDFVGLDASTSWLLADVDMDEEPEFGFRHDHVGTHAIGPSEDGAVGIVLTEPDLVHDRDPTIEDLRTQLVAVYGTDFGLRGARWLSRFTDMTRQAATYRKGRVLLAGDAAHVHPPHGGQGLNTGVQDAVNLGWKLAQVANGTSPDDLLDTYHAERHPVGAEAIRNTEALVALARPDGRSRAVKDLMTELVGMDEPRRRVAGSLSGLDVRYDLGDGHPLVGRRMPDLDLETYDGAARVFELLHPARPVLLDLTGEGGFDASGWPARVRVVAARPGGALDVPVVGAVATPPAVLIRPDGHVVWAGVLDDSGLRDVAAIWFGAS